MEVALQVEPEVAALLPAGAAARLRQRARRALRTMKADGDLSVLLTSDRAIAALNRTYRKVARPTDVLSFSQREGAAMPTPMLGDLVISLETVARRRKRAFEEELLHLLVHGLAHLLGWDHATPAEARRMFAYERDVKGKVLARETRSPSGPRARASRGRACRRRG